MNNNSQATVVYSVQCVVVVIYYVTIEAIGHGLLEKFWPFSDNVSPG